MVREEREVYASRLEQLRCLGVTLPLAYELTRIESASPIRIEQLETEVESCVSALPDGQTLLLAWISLRAERPGLRLHEFRLAPPWPDADIHPVPMSRDNELGDYHTLPGGLQFLTEDILNCNFRKSGWRVPYHEVKGVLCAISETPVPDHYQHGDEISAGLQLFSRSGRVLGATKVTLWVDVWDARCAQHEAAEKSKQASKSAASTKPRRSIFEEEPAYEPWVAVRPLPKDGALSAVTWPSPDGVGLNLQCGVASTVTQPRDADERSSASSARCTSTASSKFT